MKVVPVQLTKVWDDLRSSLWFRPAIWVIVLGSLAVALTLADERLAESGSLFDWPWFLVGGAEGARTMLGAIASAMLTVTSLTFSIVIVAVVQTANAYSPSVLRQYLSDTANQHVLGIMIGTFLFSLLVLRGVRSTDDQEFVPTLAINTAVLLSLLSVGAFIYFINHASHSIKVDNIIQMVRSRTEDLMANMFPMTLGRPWPEETSPDLPSALAATIHAHESGRLQFYELEELMAAAAGANAIVRLERGVGDYVLQGTPLFTVWPAGALDEALARALRQATVLGRERSMVQDVLFGLQQLSDIALRALSPGINNPSTAVNSINALAALLIHFLQYTPISPYRCDEAGKLRIIAPTLTFAQMLDHAYGQISRYGAGDTATMLRLLEICGELGYVTGDPGEREALWQWVQALIFLAGDHVELPDDRQKINERLERVAATLQKDAESLHLTVYNQEDA